MSEKYPTTYHFPFSPGIEKQDEVNYNYWEKIRNEIVVITEKLDGENNCMKRKGLFARSHTVIAKSGWTDHLKPKWAQIRYVLGDLEIFLENLYGIHSIEYFGLTNYFYVFSIRELDWWLSWEDVGLYSQLVDFPVVPTITTLDLKTFGKQQFDDYIDKEARKPSLLGGNREGLVVRVIRKFHNDEFCDCIIKWVRKGHVQTDEHWTKNWQKAKLKTS